MRIFGLFTIIIPMVIMIISCQSKVKDNFLTGGIYSIESGSGDFGVAKVLVTEGDTIHIRLYSNRFKKRPSSIKSLELSLKPIDDKNAEAGIEHFPMRKTDFILWKPKLIIRLKVEEEELEGYKMWKKGGGEVWERK